MLKFGKREKRLREFSKLAQTNKNDQNKTKIPSQNYHQNSAPPYSHIAVQVHGL